MTFHLVGDCPQVEIRAGRQVSKRGNEMKTFKKYFICAKGNYICIYEEVVGRV